MEKDTRPLSPHLQVYRLPVTALMSILHRMTGVVSAFGLIMISCWLAAAATGEAGWHSANALFSNSLIVLIMFLWSAALIYHLCNGIRHLIWDAGKCLEKEAAIKAGRKVQIATAVLTLLLWIAIAL